MQLAFVRHFVGPTGGNIALRGFFHHARVYPGLQVRIAFTGHTREAGVRFWGATRDDIEDSLEKALEADIVAVNGKDWRLIPPDFAGTVLHLVQHLGYPRDPALLEYLRRPAFRLCISHEVLKSIAPHANGPCRVVPNSADTTLFRPSASRPGSSILIGGQKSPDVARALAAAFPQATVLTNWVPQEQFAALIRRHEIFVALPGRDEGFYLPPLEAMACGCAVVCSDARGNRGHCVPEINCVQPKWNDLEDHTRSIRRLLADEQLRQRMQNNGLATAARFSPDNQRRAFHALLDEMTGAFRAKKSNFDSNEERSGKDSLNSESSL